MDAKEVLARIEKLPDGWRHPKVCPNRGGAERLYFDGVWYPISVDIALDLHLRHIAEKLARRGEVPECDMHGKWFAYVLVGDRKDEVGKYVNADTFAECAVLAAEEASRG